MKLDQLLEEKRGGFCASRPSTARAMCGSSGPWPAEKPTGKAI